MDQQLQWHLLHILLTPVVMGAHKWPVHASGQHFMLQQAGQRNTYMAHCCNAHILLAVYSSDMPWCRSLLVVQP